MQVLGLGRHIMLVSLHAFVPCLHLPLLRVLVILAAQIYKRISEQLVLFGIRFNRLLKLLYLLL